MVQQCRNSRKSTWQVAQKPVVKRESPVLNYASILRENTDRFLVQRYRKEPVVQNDREKGLLIFENDKNLRKNAKFRFRYIDKYRPAIGL